MLSGLSLSRSRAIARRFAAGFAASCKRCGSYRSALERSCSICGSSRYAAKKRQRGGLTQQKIRDTSVLQRNLHNQRITAKCAKDHLKKASPADRASCIKALGRIAFYVRINSKGQNRRIRTSAVSLLDGIGYTQKHQ